MVVLSHCWMFESKRLLNWLLGLPIDLVVASAAHWRVLRAGVGPDVGSDHRPVLVQLVLLP